MGERWAAVEPTAPDAVLLHIGPFKTGTTAIQEALAASRSILAEHDIRYPGPQGHHARGAMSAMGRTFGWAGQGGAKAPKGDWRRLTALARETTGRMVLSSEYFCLARPGRIRRICADLDPQRVQVLITLRPLGLLLPSSWQQYVKSGRAVRYEPWLRAVLADPPDKAMTPSFWVRNDHPALVRRWAEVVGPDRVTVLVLDDADRPMLYEVFERLLGLAPDTLHRATTMRGNRSLSAAEAELLCLVNEEVARHEVPWPDFQAVVRDGAVRRLVDSRDPAPAEGRIRTPDWALERAEQLGKAAAADIAASGVRVIGDLDLLARRPALPPEVAPSQTLPLEVPVELLLGALSGAMRRGPRFGHVATPWPPVKQQRQRPKGVEAATAGELVGALRSRARARAARLVRRATRPVRRR